MATTGRTGATPLPARRTAPSSKTFQRHSHEPVLDGVRGLAISLVMIYHERLPLGVSAFDRFFVRVTDIGFAGVDLFFVLSGYLITGILLRTRGAPNYFRNFYARRVLRIFPLYYAFLLFCFVVLPHFPALPTGRTLTAIPYQSWFWCHLSNYLVSARGFGFGALDPMWSLAIEEQFYLVWPLIVATLDRRKLLLVSGGIMLCAFMLRAYLVHEHVSPVVAYVLTFARMDALASGALLALLTAGGARAFVRRAAPAVGLLACCVFVAVATAETTREYEGAWMQTVGYSSSAIAAAAMIVLALEPHGVMRSVLSQPLLRWFGRYSYALYVVHDPVRAIVRDKIFAPLEIPRIAGSDIVRQCSFIVVSTALSALVAWCSWNMLEKRFLVLKRYFETPASRADA